jgi:hypothetical protein
VHGKRIRTTLPAACVASALASSLRAGRITTSTRSWLAASPRVAPASPSISEGDADTKLLSYQYLRMLPELARGDANRVFVIPSESDPTKTAA